MQTDEHMDEPTHEENLLLKRLRRVVRGFRELHGVLKVLENTCPYCWNGDKDCMCRQEDESRCPSAE